MDKGHPINKPAEITTGQHTAEALEIWTALLSLHKEMKLGDMITHPMREKVANLAKRQFALSQELAKVTSYNRPK